MPLLPSSSLRNKASLIAVFLILEIMAILWFKETGPVHHGRRGSSHDRQHEQPHLQQHGQNRDAKQEQHVSMVDLRARGDHKPVDSKGRTHRHYHHHHDSHAVTKDISIASALSGRANHVSAESTTIMKPSRPSLPKVAATSISKLIPPKDKNNKSFNKHSRRNKTLKDSGSLRQKQIQEKNQRGGFKSTEERKKAQLIPVLDESGVMVEDHFISPRDSDGDGIPDFYVLLRPTANSKYMMDVGLFDDEVVNPDTPAVLSSPSPSSVVVDPAAPAVANSVTSATGTT